MDSIGVKVMAPEANRPFAEELDELRATRAEMKSIRLSAQQELALARQIRTGAERYHRETETKARSQAQLLILQARLATQKEIAELKRKAGEEIQKILADIRMIRITAQEELEAQRRFNNASRITTLSQATQRRASRSPGKEKKAVSV